MSRLTAQDFSPELLQLYDFYAHGKITKRQFLSQSAKFAVGGFAAVPFYGRQASPEDVPKIQAPLLLHFAEHDANVNQTWPAYEAALKEHGKTYEAYTYPGANHGFHNDSTPRYDKDAANLAWRRTVDWFKRYLV